MAQLPDLVRDSKLETHFLPDSSIETVHTYHESDPVSQQRLVTRSEHWQRQKKIGGGSFGSVWLEKCTKGGHRDIEVRAIKQIEIDRRYAQIDYSRELEAIAKFSHWKYERCFVKSFGWYESPEQLFIAMEYLELGDLQTYLHHKPPLPEHEAKEVTYQILDGLCLMHNNKFVHRDLKPNNILLKGCPPNAWWVKIADFGISKRIEDELVRSTTLKGTLGYIAPELHGFTKQGTPYAVDIWAVGEIAFQMLTKQPTFKNLGLLSNYVKKPDTFPSNLLLAAQVSQLGVECIISLMHPTPIDRITAEKALHHKWMDKLLPYRRASAALAYMEVYTASAIDLMTKEFATWNTTPATVIPRKTEEFRTSPLQTSSDETVRFQPTQNTTSSSSDCRLLASGDGNAASVTDISEGNLLLIDPDTLVTNSTATQDISASMAQQAMPLENMTGEVNDGWIPLYSASEIGNIRIVRVLLTAGEDVNASTGNGRTPLMAASEKGHLEVAETLLAGGADCQVVDKDRWTSLHLAARNGHKRIVELLIANGAAVDLINLDVRTPLWYASEHGHDTVVELLLSTRKVHADIRDRWGESPLWWAARNGHEGVVKLLLASDMVDVNARSGGGFPDLTPLWWAAREGHEVIVDLLLTSEMLDVDARMGNGRNESPLFWAARHGHEGIVRKLMATGKVEIDIRNGENRTPFWWACSEGHDSIVKLLLATGKVDANIYDQWNETPLWWAARHGHDEVVKLLLATGRVDVNSKSGDGRDETPLWWAAREGHDSTVEILLASGLADADAKSGNGTDETPLWWAARNGHESIVRRLLATGKVDHSSRSGDGSTPLLAAAQNGHDAIVKLIARQ